MRGMGTLVSPGLNAEENSRCGLTRKRGDGADPAPLGSMPRDLHFSWLTLPEKCNDHVS